jgi:Gon7 family
MPNLTATYTSPLVSTPHIFTNPLPAAASKSQHLADLRKAVVALQNDVNAYLTARMEEEKTGGAVAEAEEKYGEEEEEEEEEEGNK